MLKFIGDGSAFNTKRGNNAVYVKEDSELFLIDCGSDVFGRIKESNVLENTSNYQAFITHTHGDHIGSLGDFIFYTYFAIEPIGIKKIKILTVEDTNTKQVLDLMGCVEGVHYDIEYLDEGKEKEINIEGIKIKPFKTEHYPNMNSYGLEIRKEDKKYFYSSDANIKTYKNINFDDYELSYVDTCKSDYEGNVHLSLRELLEITTEEQRKKIVCMHLDEKTEEEELKAYGFKIAGTE